MEGGALMRAGARQSDFGLDVSIVDWDSVESVEKV